MTSYTKQELIDKLPVMTAWTQGKQVQFKGTFPSNKDKWIDTTNPSWDSGIEYRIKPEAVKVEKWACYWIEGDLVACSFDTKLCAEEACVQRNSNNSGTYIAIQMEGTYER